MGRVNGKVAVVTGGSAGLGRADAIALAREGARVVVTDVNEAEGRKSLPKSTHRIRVPPCSSWPVAVRAGDRLRAQYECRSKRPSATDPTRSIVEFRYTLRNQNDQIAWTCRSINLVGTGPRTAT